MTKKEELKLKIANLEGDKVHELIPTTLLEEKHFNPFLEVEKYSSLVNGKSPAHTFEMLKNLRKNWKK